MSEIAAAAAPRRLRLTAAWGLLRRWTRAHPVALGAAALFALAAVLTGSLRGQDVSAWGAGPVAVFGQGRWWTLVTALLVPDSALDAVLSVAAALTLLAYAERLLGHRRLLWTAAAVGVGGLLIALGLHAASWAVTELQPFDDGETPIADPTILIVGATAAATSFASALWRRRLRLLGLATLTMLALYDGDTGDWYRLVAAGVGLLAGAWAARSRIERGWHRSSVKETRSLVAVLIAVAGLGPLAALAANDGRGPFSAVVGMFAQYDQHFVNWCVAHPVAACDNQLVAVVTRGAGPALLALVPLALLLVAAAGLRQGRRSAWLLAIAVETALGALALYQAASDQIDIDPWVDGTGLEYVLWGVASIGLPAALIGLLLLTGDAFPLRATRRAAWTFASSIAAVFIACGAVFVVVGSMGRAAFNISPLPVDLLVGMIRRFIPPAFLGDLPQPPYPRHGAALIAFQWTGVAFWAGVVLGMLLLYRSTAHRPEQDAVRYRQLLRRGGGSLSWQGTWPGNSYWYAADGRSAIAYRLVGEVALAHADPLVPEAERGAAIRGFVEYCAGRNWTPVFYSIHDEFLPELEAMGWGTLPVGEETVMALPGLSFDGKSWQHVRHPLRRAEREGMTAIRTSWPALSPGQVAQLVEINEQWVADKALPELGFTLGTLEELKDPEVALLLAVDAEGRIQAATSWMPCWRDGSRIGWTLDFMRRRLDAPNGVMEFLIASAALRMRDEGLEFLSLSGAPLASSDPEPATTPLSGFLAWLAGVLEPAYGFASLFRFKRKFHPEYRPMYLAYADPIELPRIGLAIARAYLPTGTARGALSLMRAIRSLR